MKSRNRSHINPLLPSLCLATAAMTMALTPQRATATDLILGDIPPFETLMLFGGLDYSYNNGVIGESYFAALFVSGDNTSASFAGNFEVGVHESGLVLVDDGAVLRLASGMAIGADVSGYTSRASASGSGTKFVVAIGETYVGKNAGGKLAIEDHVAMHARNLYIGHASGSHGEMVVKSSATVSAVGTNNNYIYAAPPAREN
ncbi:hypothetical protein [Mucisphaera calidilacus]|uniref:Uncharacterized protein n=1 Tax=Mucisphaera calidilacus TaxID=2527982 RepID=A0A518C036_9BACT|nr:hypothetical protein [Mucisphaera calidilacus]QDU72583.1 hypothetical protein Pan265_24530 [Mucisphaera calidilacus]